MMASQPERTGWILVVLTIAAVVVLLVLPFRAPAVFSFGYACNDGVAQSECDAYPPRDGYTLTATDTYTLCAVIGSVDRTNEFGTGVWHNIARVESTSCGGQRALRAGIALGLVSLLLVSRRERQDAHPEGPRPIATIGLTAALVILAISIVPFGLTERVAIAGAVSGTEPVPVIGVTDVTRTCGGLLNGPFVIYHHGRGPCDEATSAAQPFVLWLLLAVEASTLMASRRRRAPSRTAGDGDAHPARA